jgi:hypothetical protein
MPTIEVTVQVRKDGHLVPGFPIAKRIEAPYSEGFDYAKQTDLAGAFENIPVNQVVPASVVLIRAERAMTVRFAGQSDAGIDLAAGGMILILGSDISDSPIASINNVSGAEGRVVGVVLGESPP